MTTKSQQAKGKLRTKKEYIDGLSKKRRNVYFDGHLIDRTDELQMDCINTIGLTYDLAQDPKYKDLMLAKSHITGKRSTGFVIFIRAKRISTRNRT